MRNFRILTYIFILVLFSSPFWGNLVLFAGNEYFSNAYYSFDSLPPQQVNDSAISDRETIGASELARRFNNRRPGSNAADTLSAAMNDSLKVLPDSLKQFSDGLHRTITSDSLQSDSVRPKKPVLDAEVVYSSTDSLVMNADNWAFLFGSSDVKYDQIGIKAERISMNNDSSLVYATYGLDSIGKEFGHPVFSDKSTSYEAKEMKYNFKTEKGYITHGVTEQGEGYVIAQHSKKNPDNSVFLKGGQYTTCDIPGCPHWHFHLTRGKVQPGKNVVTGPATFVLEGLPIPFLTIPFGYFPFSQSYSSGVIMPSFGDEMERGFNLRGGGYYFALNDYADLALTSDIYTKGSWAVYANTNYRKVYKYSGSAALSYMVNKFGEKIDPDYSQSTDMSVSWQHRQDPKANAYRTLSASVRFSTSKYDRNHIDSQFSPNYTNNNKSSTVNLTQRFPNSPWSLSAAMGIDQVSSTETVSMTLPDLSATMSSVYPLKKKEVVGAEKWYEKIRLSYSGHFRNSLRAKEDEVFKSNLQTDWQHAVKHNIPVSATFNWLNNINVTPSFTYTERWYTNKINKKWNGSSNVVSDTIQSLNRVYDFNTSVSFQTKLYGMYGFSKKDAKIQDVRHVFSPSVSLGYRPDFSDPRFGLYESYYYYDGNGKLQKHVYSPYQNGMYGTAPSGKSGMVNFQFDNNLEMKVRSLGDSLGYKKISLLDNFGVGFSYNMMADSMKWSDITSNIRLKLSKTFTVNLNGTFDTYMYEVSNWKMADNGNGEMVRVPANINRINMLRIENGRGLGRLRSTSFSFSHSINQDTYKKLFGGGDRDKKDLPPNNTDESGDSETPRTNDVKQIERTSRLGRSGNENKGAFDDDGYLRNSVKWNLSFNYSVNYGYSSDIEWDGGRFAEYKRRLTHNLGFSGGIQPTKNWNITFSSGYDWDAKKITYTTFNFTRDLHCWSVSGHFSPLGQYKSYYVTIRASSSILQDLKYEKRGRSSGYDPQWD